MADPIRLIADLEHNPWAKRYGLTDHRITGTVTSAVEDAEGNVFTPDRMNWTPFLKDGYLDIDHAYFNNEIEDGVIGVPEMVMVYPEHVEVTFRLLRRSDAQAIYEYVRDHPNELGYSIAGPLQKDILDRNGYWPGVASVALTHAPINAETNAIALSSALFGQVVQTTQALAALQTPPTSPADWRTWFQSQGWDWWTAHGLSLWAQNYFQAKTLQATPAIKRKLLDNLLIPPDALDGISARIAADMAAYRKTHPHDPHFQPDGRFYSAAHAIAHYKHCVGLTKEQVAHILGVIRNNRKFIIHPPAAQFAAN